MCRRYYDMQGPSWAGIYLQYRSRSLRALLGGTLCTAASCLRRSSSTSSRRSSSTSSSSSTSFCRRMDSCALLQVAWREGHHHHGPSALGWISLHTRVPENGASTFFGIPLDQSNQYELKRLISTKSFEPHITNTAKKAKTSIAKEVTLETKSAWGKYDLSGFEQIC